MSKEQKNSSGTGSQDKLKKPKKKRKDRRVEKEYSDWIEYTDPLTGKIVRTKAKVTRYKTKGDRFNKKSVVDEELGWEYSEDSED